MSNQNGYIGRSPGDSAVIIASQTFEPTGIQTDFTFASGYDPGYIDVYFNGARLVYANDYTATNGSTVGLTTYANNGDVLELVAYKAFNVGAVDAANGNFSVGNQLTVSGVTTATSAYYTGIVTATSFSGDGSSLTGLANTDVINTENINVIGVATVGSAVTINSTGIDAVSGVITASSFVGGGANITALSGTNIASGTVAAARVATLNQNTSGTAGGLTGTPDITVRNITGVAATFTGVLTYEDVTNVDSIGLVTARSGIQFGAAGVGGTIRANGDTTLAGVVTATKFKGDGSELTGVVSGIELFQAGSSVGTSLTAVNFASGATLTTGSSGFSTVTIAAGITTTAGTASGIVTTLLLSDAQDHKVIATGICTITVSGGTEGESHSVRIINSGIATVRFSTYFLFPSGNTPVLPTADTSISLISFTVNRVGLGGTQLLAGASLNFS